MSLCLIVSGVSSLFDAALAMLRVTTGETLAMS